jgi:beta-glucosidase
MMVSSRFNIRGGFLVFLAGSALGNTNSSSSSPPPSVTFPPVSGYTMKVYNVSAATTTLSYNYTNEELAMLWNQVGKIAIGPITTTVSPTPEPSAYPRPGPLHPQVISPMITRTFLMQE